MVAFFETVLSHQNAPVLLFRKSFQPYEGTNFFITHLPSYFFPLKDLKGSSQTPAVDHMRLKTLRDTKSAFIIPKSYDEHPCHSCDQFCQTRILPKIRVQ